MRQFARGPGIRLTLLALVTIVPALAFIAYDQTIERSRARAQAVDDAIGLARLAARNQAAVLDGVQRLLLTLSRVATLRDRDPAACNALLAGVLRDHPGYANIWVTEADGSGFCQAVPVDPRTSSAGRAWFERVLRTRAVAMSDYQVSHTTGKPDVVIAQPLLSADGRVERVLAAGVGVAELDSVVQAVGMPAGWVLAVVDRNGTIVARYPTTPKMVGRTLPPALSLARAQQAPNALIDAPGTDGTDRLYALVPLASPMDTGMYVALEVDPRVVFANSNALLRTHLWLLGIVTFVAIAGGLVSGRIFVLRPIDALTRVTSRIASGDFTGRTQLARGAPGLRDLGAAIDQMALALESRERTRAEIDERLQASERRYRLLFEANPHPMWVYDAETLRFLEVNDAATGLYGYTRDEFLAKRIIEMVRSEDVDLALASIASTRGTPRYSGQWRHRLKSGALIDVEITSHPITFNGRAARLGTAHDITRRVQAENARRFLAGIVENSDDAIIGRTLDGVIISWNAGAEKLYGYTAAEAVGQPLRIIVPDDRLAELTRLLDEVSRGQHVRHVETLRRRKDGSLLTVSLTMSPVWDESGRITGASAIARDIGDRQRAERAVREAEERMRFALDAARVGIWEARFADRSTFWSETCEVMHGLAPGAFGGTMTRVMACIHPDDREPVRRSFDEAMLERRTLDIAYRTVAADGTERRVSAKGQFFYDEQGAPVAAAGVAIDVTDQWLLEEQLRQSQKMDAIGQLAGGIAHDFNNVLTAILGNAEIFLDEASQHDPHRRTIEEIQTAGRAAANLTRQLLAFSRRQMLAPKILRLGDSVSEVTPILRRLLGASIKLNTALSDTGCVKADAGQIQQVLINFTVNARDAMPYGGRLAIETSDVTLDETYARRYPNVRPGPYVLISVTDTGHGMDAGTQRRLFEPFFTTKPKGHGTGLGLATVHGIVRQSDGHVTVESEVGVGTTFKVYLPKTEEVEALPGATTVDPAALTGTETILLVEDEAGVRDFVYRVLTRYGYRVYALPDPQHAIEFARAFREPIDIIVTDVVLPDINGQITAARIRALHPGARVLYMSGYTDIAVVTGSELEPGTWFLKKPFTAETLGRRVREILDAQIA